MAKGEHKKKSISFTLMIHFIVVIMVPFAILSFFILQSYKTGVERFVSNNTKEALNLVNYKINQQFLEYSNLAYFISRDRQFQEIANYDSENEYNMQTEFKGCIWKLLNYYRSSVADVSHVVLSFENGISISTNSIMAVKQEPLKQAWYEQCYRQQDISHLNYFAPKEKAYDGYDASPIGILSESHSIQDKYGNYIGAVSVGVYIQVLEQSVANILNNNGAYIYILNDDNQIIYSPIVGKLPDITTQKNICIEKVYNVNNKWTIIGVVPMTSYFMDMNTSISMCLSVMVFTLIMMAISSRKVSVSIVLPIQKLQRLMEQAENGNLTVRFTEKAPIEIKRLGESFNIMILKLDNNIQQVYIEQRAKRKAEVAAFQANVKPHFLYNTLDTIHWMAKEYQANDIVETVDALATLFRIALSKGSDMIYVEQEIKHVTSYLQIQKMRYEDMISYEIHMADDCRKLKVQKMILQPLVENAIYHGIKNSGRVGKIKINIWREKEQVLLAVEDDGIGMSPARLAEVKDALKKFNPETKVAYGVVNVHYRLFLEYGEPYGLYLESEELIGTTALICHPVIEEEE